VSLKDAFKEGGGGGCCQNSKKNTDFVDTLLSNILHDLPFSQIQPLKAAY